MPQQNEAGNMSTAEATETYLHSEVDVGPDQLVQIRLRGTAANVLLLDDLNFAKYKAKESYRYFGGYSQKSPVRLRPPNPGRWHVVIDLGSRPGYVDAAVSVTGSNG